jgi:hypothetical protein
MTDRITPERVIIMPGAPLTGILMVIVKRITKRMTMQTTVMPGQPVTAFTRKVWRHGMAVNFTAGLLRPVNNLI